MAILFEKVELIPDMEKPKYVELINICKKNAIDGVIRFPCSTRREAMSLRATIHNHAHNVVDINTHRLRTRLLPEGDVYFYIYVWTEKRNSQTKETKDGKAGIESY
jgi:hypothetical protein